nr:MAG: maturation protein [Sanya steitz-like virus 3]
MFSGYKSRSNVNSSPGCSIITYNHGTNNVVATTPNSGAKKLTRTEWMYTRSNPIRMLKNNPLGFDLGSDWECSQGYSEFHPAAANTMIRRTTPALDYAASGFCNPDVDDSMWPGAPTITQNQMYLWGTTGFAQTAPNRPQASASQFIYELHDLPKLPFAEAVKDKARYFRNLARHSGSEYLNVEFGWKPFISDVHKAVHSMASAQQWYHQFLKDSGQLVRRRYNLPKTSSLPTTSSYSGPAVGWQSLVYTQNCLHTRVTQSHTEAWFSAAYQYYIPQVRGKWASRFQEGLAIANHLGLTIDPHTLWSIAPWEWMTDWFGNIGDVLSNVSNFNKDNLVARWAYVMATSTNERTITSTGTCPDTGTTLSASCKLTQVYKCRYPATPYGFGVTQPFSAARLAILAALGISRVPYRP